MKAALVLVAAVVVAGCAGTTSLPTTEPPAPAAYRLDCSISNWDDPCTVRASPNDSPSKTEIDVAVDPNDPDIVFVASKDLDPLATDACVWAVGQVSHDGGRTWSTVYIGGTQDERPATHPLSGWRCITDPILQFEPDGTLRYSLQAYLYRPLGDLPGVGTPIGPTPPEMGFMFQAISEDGGRTFPETMLLHAGDASFVFHDYMRMGRNPATGTVFTVWNQLTMAGLGYESVPTTVAVKQDARTAQPPAYFPRITADEPGLSLGASGIVGTNDGTVVAWLAGFNSPNEAWASRSTDDGATWSVPAKAFDFIPMGSLEPHERDGETYEPKYRTGTSVEVAADTSGGLHEGCLYAAWADGAADVADIVVTRSCDHAATWDTPRSVHRATAEDAQWMPRIAVDAHGGVHIVYLTRHHDRNHDFVDAEWAHSADGGQTWTTQRLTARSYDGNLGVHQNGFPFLGDYIGIDTSGGVTYMGFPDCHTGRCEIAVAKAVRADTASA